MQTTLGRRTLSAVADAGSETEPGRTYVAARVGGRRRVRVEWPGTSTVSRTWFHERFPELDWGAGVQAAAISPGRCSSTSPTSPPWRRTGVPTWRRTC